MSEIVEWHTKEVVAHFAAELATRLETAAKVVEVDARNNLAAISDPEWGHAYRNEIVGRLLTSFVQHTDKEVLAYIGVRAVSGKGGDSHGFYIETGSTTAPAQPWLRPALFDNEANIMKLLEGG